MVYSRKYYKHNALVLRKDINMEKKRNILIFFFMLTFAISILPLSPIPTADAVGPATDTIIFQQISQQLAAQAIIAGEIDYYYFGLSPANTELLADDSDYTLYLAPSGLNGLGINPAPSTADIFNPFSIRDVRFALNYLIDRDYIVNQIYGGFAAPMYTFLSSYDPDFVTIYDIVAKYEFSYDLTTAASLIDPAMTAAGCTKVEGKWNYNGEPVVISFVIRTEDERRDIGDAVASALEVVGFTVDRQYMLFGSAIPIVYGTDPGELEWMLYTEGWGKGALDKYDSSSINQFGAPWFTWMPGFLEEGWWSYTNETIDVLGKRIFNGEFTSKAERDDLYREMTELIVQESLRVWACTTLDIYPASSAVNGLTEDLGAGLRALWNPREAYIPGEDTLTVASLWVWTETSVYNPIAGHDDIYSVDIMRALQDPFMWNHPFSGVPMPFRATYDVVTAGPLGTLDVPSDAWLWNADTDIWEAVGAGVTATSKVVFDKSNYIGDHWHHNATIGWDDILFSISQLYEITYDTVKSGMESSTAAQLAAVLPQFKGYKIVGNTFEVYVDYWHFDENYIASYAELLDPAEPTGHYPWEVLAAMDQVVFVDGTYAYSDSASDRLGVPWLSLVLSDHAAAVNTAVQALNFADFASIFDVPGNTIYATEADLTARKAASATWFADHDNMVISDGPFYLDEFSAAGGSAVLKAVRDITYPFSQGKWDYGRASAPEITQVGIPTVVPGGASGFVVELSGVPPLGVKYLIRDPLTGEILDIGDAVALTSSKFNIPLSAEFTATLDPGLYELSVAGYSEMVAMVSTVKTYFDVFNVIPLQTAFQDVGTSVSSDISSVNASLSSAIEGLSSTLTTLMALIGIVAILVVVDIALPLRKK